MAPWYNGSSYRAFDATKLLILGCVFVVKQMLAHLHGV